jgi:hypothetical protein
MSNTEYECDVCHEEAWGFSILGMMPWEKQLNPHVKACLKCCDTAPCGQKGHWYNGELTCPHGYQYKHDADWIVVGEQAVLEWRIVNTTWWRKIKTFFGIEGHS